MDKCEGHSEYTSLVKDTERNALFEMSHISQVGCNSRRHVVAAKWRLLKKDRTLLPRGYPTAEWALAHCQRNTFRPLSQNGLRRKPRKFLSMKLRPLQLSTIRGGAHGFHVKGFGGQIYVNGRTCYFCVGRRFCFSVVCAHMVGAIS